jgi:hypothetical protein
LSKYCFFRNNHIILSFLFSFNIKLFHIVFHFYSRYFTDNVYNNVKTPKEIILVIGGYLSNKFFCYFYCKHPFIQNDKCTICCFENLLIHLFLQRFTWVCFKNYLYHLIEIFEKENRNPDSGSCLVILTVWSWGEDE